MNHLKVIAYRGLAFAQRFGFTVRDLMMARALERSELVEHVDFFERPGLPHEILSEMLRGVAQLGPKARRWRGLDLGLPQALFKRRLRAASSFRVHNAKLSRTVQGAPRAILLDFHPFFIPPVEAVTSSVYWYDLIDNFEKHNRFSPSEICQVRRKYAFVRKHALVVTGVTAGAVSSFGGVVVPNRLLAEMTGRCTGEPEYDVGFVGFLTDKFDVEFIRRLGDAGYRVLICGHAYDRGVLRALGRIRNVTYAGPFSTRDVSTLMSRFRVGLVPYLEAKRHDESPIKFFQYVAHGRPVILSSTFNQMETRFSGFVHYYRREDLTSTVGFLEGIRDDFDRISVDLRRLAEEQPELYWEGVVDDLIGMVLRSSDPAALGATRVVL